MNLIPPHGSPSALFLEPPPIPGPHLLLGRSNPSHVRLRGAEPFTSIPSLRCARHQSRGFAFDRAPRTPRCLMYLLRRRNLALRPVLVGLRAGDEPAGRFGVTAVIGENRCCAHDDGAPRKSAGGAREEECGGRVSCWRRPA